MATDAQVIRLRQLLGEGRPLSLAALKVGMGAKTAREYKRGQRLPCESFTPRTWRTREDPFQESGPNSVTNLKIPWPLSQHALR